MVELTDLRERLQRVPSPVADAALAVAVAAAIAVSIDTTAEENARDPNALAYVIAVATGSLLLLRRRHPLGVLVGSVALLNVYYALDFPGIAMAIPLAAAAYFAALAGRLVPAAVLLAGMELLGLGFRTIEEEETLIEAIGVSTIADVALLSCVLVLGQAVRNRRAYDQEVQARMRRAEADRERETARRVAEERLRIARELHDVLAHTIAVVNLQAGVAADVLDDSPDQARESLRAIRAKSREAMAELSATVGVLRAGGEEAPRAPAPGLAQLHDLVEVAGDARVRVDVSLDGPPRELPAAVDVTAYRIVQESLTNVVKHARATEARVRIHYEPGAVVVRVEDDGRGAGNGTSAGGHGLIGMTERASALGGRLATGPAPAGGFRVEAWLPTEITSP